MPSPNAPKPSYGNPNPVPYYRDDTVSQNNKIDNPSQYGRGDSHAGDPHYEGDNARPIFPGQADYLENTDRYKRISGILDFGVNHSVWKNDDKVIYDAVLNKIASKYQVDPKLITVFVDRQNGKVKYDYRWFYQIKSAKPEKEDPNLALFADVPRGTQFTLESSSLDAVRRALAPHGVIIDEKTIFVKMNDNYDDKTWNAKIIRGQDTVEYGGQEEPPWSFKQFTPIKLLTPATEHDSTKQKLMKFKDIADKEEFVFTRDTYPDVLRKRKLPYDAVLIKDGKGATMKDRNIRITEINPEYPVYRAIDVKKLQYKKDDIERALDLFFSKYKTKDTAYGIQVTAPLADLDAVFKQANVPVAKFEQMTGISYDYRGEDGKIINEAEYKKQKASGKKVTKTFATDKDQGIYKNYSWTIDTNANEIIITEARK